MAFCLCRHNACASIFGFFCQIRNLSDAQWSEVQELKRKANQALNNSKSANSKMDEALTQQTATEEEITIIDNKVNERITLADKAATNASAAYNIASNTLDDAENLLSEAAIPLDVVNINETKGKTV